MSHPLQGFTKFLKKHAKVKFELPKKAKVSGSRGGELPEGGGWASSWACGRALAALAQLQGRRGARRTGPLPGVICLVCDGEQALTGP